MTGRRRRDCFPQVGFAPLNPDKTWYFLGMFLVGDGPERHAGQITSWMKVHPSVALVVAAVYFEWTVCRVIIGLSIAPNRVVRHELERIYGLPKLSGFWNRQLRHLPGYLALKSVINFKAVESAFEARNRLAHGKDRYTTNMAQPHVGALLEAVTAVRAFCLARGFDPMKKLPIRRKARPVTAKEIA